MSGRIGYEGKRWDCYFWFVGWDCISLGVSVCVFGPNVELHLPFGFVRLGRRPPSRATNPLRVERRGDGVWVNGDRMPVYDPRSAALMGEQPPEMVMPLKRGANGRLY